MLPRVGGTGAGSLNPWLISSADSVERPGQVQDTQGSGVRIKGQNKRPIQAEMKP